MKRIAVKLLIFLLLGAVVNVAVAWGCCLFTSDMLFTTSTAVAEEWPRPVPPEWPSRPSIVTSDHGFGVTVHLAYGKMRSHPHMQWEFQKTVLAGVPWRCLAAERRRMANPFFPNDPRDEWHGGSFLDGILVPDFLFDIKRNERQVLPTHSILPAFAINTLIYTVILWLLFAAPFALRRWRRVRKGLCPKCAYPIGERAICTECGQPIRRVVPNAESQRGINT